MTSRRGFLRGSLLLAGAWASGTEPVRADVLPRRIRIGFLGLAYSHGEPKLRLAHASPDWEVVGVCDPSEAAARVARELGVETCDERELLRRAEVVAVESEVADHYPMGRRVLEAGRHLHLEKPPALRVPDMRRLVSLARPRGLRLQCGYMWRHHPGFRAVRELVRAGGLGEVFQVHGFLHNRLDAERRREWARLPGGSMFELGSHLVDATVRLLGRPSKVTPFLRHHGLAEDALADNNVAVLEYARATAVLTNTALPTGAGWPRSFEVLGTRGTARLSPLEPGELELDLLEASGPYRKGLQKVPLPTYRRYEGDLAELAASVRDGVPLTASLEEEFLVQETLCRICGA